MVDNMLVTDGHGPDSQMSECDQLIRRAKEIWVDSDECPNPSSSEVEALCEQWCTTSSHAAFGWIALTCGKHKLFANELDAAEGLLSEALGRLLFVGDRQGADI